jgi:hypothetical protein
MDVSSFVAVLRIELIAKERGAKLEFEMFEYRRPYLRPSSLRPLVEVPLL